MGGDRFDVGEGGDGEGFLSGRREGGRKMDDERCEILRLEEDADGSDWTRRCVGGGGWVRLGAVEAGLNILANSEGLGRYMIGDGE